MTEWLGTKEASKILNVSQRTIQKWIDGGKITSIKTLGGHRRIRREHLFEFIEHEKYQIVETKYNRPLSVVLVEDNELTRRLYELSFQTFRTPYQLYMACNGYEGLRLIGKHQPDLLLTDLKMPGIDGFEMIRELQKASDLNELRIVVITGMAAKDIYRYGSLPESITVLTKPLSFGTLETIFTQRAVTLGIIDIEKQKSSELTINQA